MQQSATHHLLLAAAHLVGVEGVDGHDVGRGLVARHWAVAPVAAVLRGGAGAVGCLVVRRLVAVAVVGCAWRCVRSGSMCWAASCGMGGCGAAWARAHVCSQENACQATPSSVCRLSPPAHTHLQSSALALRRTAAGGAAGAAALVVERRTVLGARCTCLRHLGWPHPRHSHSCRWPHRTGCLLAALARHRPRLGQADCHSCHWQRLHHTCLQGVRRRVLLHQMVGALSCLQDHPGCKAAGCRLSPQSNLLAVSGGR